MNILDKLSGMGREEPREQVPVDPETLGMLVTQPETMHHIGTEEIAAAMGIMEQYKEGKANLEARIIENAQWFRLRHWDVLRRKYNENCTKENRRRKLADPTSGWLFNAIASKHADAMDNYPEPIVLPREQADEESADQLSQILPVVMEINNYPRTYRNAWWTKLIQGMALYGVFWDSTLLNGLGDISIKEIDLLKCYWEPGITDLQDSHNLFIIDLVDDEDMKAAWPEQYPYLQSGPAVDVKHYVFDDSVDTSGKHLVVDWYYHRQLASGKRVLHLCKFSGNQVLFASENEEQYQETGWYADDRYPVVMDGLFPEPGTPVHFGFVDLCKNPQMYIDRLWDNILRTSDTGTRKKWFVNTNSDINRDQLLDPDEPLVECSGAVSDDRLKEIVTRPLDSIYVNILQLKIDEMKDTAANRDVNNGGTGSGITAAAAISALQEAGNKVSRDMIKGGFDAQSDIYDMCIERIRQFYDVVRTFRITNDQGGYEFVEFSNQGMQEQEIPPYPGQQNYEQVFRAPVFDLKVSAQRKNPFSRMEQNERALNLYSAGFFQPENAQPALSCLEMMEFEGIEKVREKVREGQTLYNTIQQMAVQMDQMAMMLQQLTGTDMGVGGPAPDQGGQQQPKKEAKAADGEGSQVMESQAPQTGYQERLAQRSSPKV